MAHRKAGGTAKSLKDSKPKYLGVKLANGQQAKIGSIIIRQRGTKFLLGKNVGLGKDHTIFATKQGVVKFTEKRKKHYDNSVKKRKVVNIV
jgi:large subunit ribosomal protein L27